MSVTWVRKGFQFAALAGVAISLLLVPLVNSAWMAIGIMSAGSFAGGLVAGGLLVNHMDLAPRHAGSLMGFGNTFATLPGIFGVAISGMILNATGSWALVFQTAAAVALVGAFIFLIFGSTEKQFD